MNYKDETFIKTLLDENSIKFFEKNLNKVNDVLTRSLIWRSFFDMVRDAKLSAEDYINFVI